MTLPVVERSLPRDLPEQLAEVGERPIATGSTSHVYPAKLLPRRVDVVLKLEAHVGAWTVDEVAVANAVGSRYLMEVAQQVTFADGRKGLVLPRRVVLSERLRKRDGAPRDAVCWMRDVARGLADLHRVGLVHRDVCPSNVFVSAGQGAPARAWIGDLGSAGAPSRELGQPLVDEDYRAPEILLGEGSSPASDIYALGVLCGELARSLPPSFRTRSLREIRDRAAVDDPAHRLSAEGAAAILDRSLGRERVFLAMAGAAAIAAALAVVVSATPVARTPEAAQRPARSDSERVTSGAATEPASPPRRETAAPKRPAPVLRTRPTFPDEAPAPTRTMDPTP